MNIILDPFLQPEIGEIIKLSQFTSEGFVDIDKPVKSYIVMSIEYGKELTSWGSPEETIVNLKEI